MKRLTINLAAASVILVGMASAFAMPMTILSRDKCSSDDGTSSCSCARTCTKTENGCSCS